MKLKTAGCIVQHLGCLLTCLLLLCLVWVHLAQPMCQKVLHENYKYVLYALLGTIVESIVGHKRTGKGHGVL